MDIESLHMAVCFLVEYGKVEDTIGAGLLDIDEKASVELLRGLLIPLILYIHMDGKDIWNRIWDGMAPNRHKKQTNDEGLRPMQGSLFYF